MAKIRSGSEEIEVQDNSFIADVCEELGVPFGCRSGSCGQCLTIVQSGIENLSPLTECEELFGLEENERLICQCLIKTGVVEIEID